jgi:TfoX/Sxy family transcriptional regulator of competence genes
VEQTLKRTRGRAVAAKGRARSAAGATKQAAKPATLVKPARATKTTKTTKQARPARPARPAKPARSAAKVARTPKPVMPKWSKPPDALVALFAKATEKLPGVQARKMFGYPAVFVNGHMFAGLFQTSVILRMSEGDLAAARVAINAELFEPIPGRVMREYVVVPNAVVQSPKLLGDWLKRGHAFASIMPPKSAKKATSDV